MGRRIEPAAAATPLGFDAAWPWDIVLWHCPAAAAYDHARRRWWHVGDGSPLPDLHHHAPAADYTLGPAQPTLAPAEYERMVRRAVEYIHGGDCFQVNLAHRLVAEMSGAPRALFSAMLDAAAPWYGAYLEVPLHGALHAAVCVSPELFLDYQHRTRAVVTRPIKGTRPGSVSPEQLRSSGKDRAELAMIIDLMRNDLGRVCEIGSVRVDEERAIERHGWSGDRVARRSAAGSLPVHAGVHHGVATISATLRPDHTIVDLLRATFPGGSITGAPKVRSMQIIDGLEPAPRGLYTGAIGFISDCGNAAFNIAIRTAVLAGPMLDPALRGRGVRHATLTYGAGAGIVAESDPAREWQETLDKAGVLRAVQRPPAASTPRADRAPEHAA